jgi:hypothetical protein
VSYLHRAFALDREPLRCRFSCTSFRTVWDQPWEEGVDADLILEGVHLVLCPYWLLGVQTKSRALQTVSAMELLVWLYFPETEICWDLR